MAILVPPYLVNTQLHGEARVFQLFKSSSALDDAYIFHSLNIVHHQSKREGEADFVILSPKGLLILEVKGATKIRRREGKWGYVSGDKFYERSESPFLQAKQNLYSLVSELEQRVDLEGSLKRISGYGVVFPNMVFKEASPEWDSKMVLDENNLDMLEAFVDGLYGYWRGRENIPDGYFLSKTTVEKIRNFIRGDFECVESMRSLSDRTVRLIESLTNEQCTYLDAIKENPRVLVKGYVGTGKTILAIEQSKRWASDGLKVCFLCFNRLLASMLKAQCRQLSSNIHVNTFDAFSRQMLTAAGIASIENVTEIRPKLHDLLDSDRVGETVQYDCFVADEGQDILGHLFVSILDRVVKGGVEHGRWTIFYDDEIQSQLFASAELVDTLTRLSASAAKITLTSNCRNPRDLLIETKRITRLPIPKEMKVITEGEVVRHISFDNAEDQADKIASSILQLIRSGLTPSRLTLLFASLPSDSLTKSIYRVLYKNVDTIVDLTQYIKSDVQGFRLGARELGYSTIQSFKGLENDIILLCDIRNLRSEYDRALVYTGLTRAKVLAILFYHSSLEPSLFAKGHSYG